MATTTSASGRPRALTAPPRRAERTGGSFAGTTFYTDRGPSVDDMPWLTTFADVDHAFRSKDWEQGGGGRRDSFEFIGDGLLALSGPDHFERRRIESLLFRKPQLRHYEHDVLLPALRERLRDVRRQRDAHGRVVVELRDLLRSCLYRVSADFVGLDGVDDEVLGDYLELLDQLSVGANVEWVVEDHRRALERADLAKKAFLTRFFEPSWRRRQDLVARYERGELDEDALPTDLITVMLRNPDHFTRWPPAVFVAETILFHGGPVNSLANAIPHTVVELDRWLVDHPGHGAALADPAFLRLCCNEALRLHPPTPFFIRRAQRDTVLPGGLEAVAGQYVVLDIIAASHDPSAFGDDVDAFDPYRAVGSGVRSTGLAFGGGPHTCIAMTMSVGDGTLSADEGAGSVGLMVCCLRELYRAGMRPDPASPTEKSGVNMRNEYASYWVELYPL